MQLKMSSAKCQPFCLGLNVLKWAISCVVILAQDIDMNILLYCNTVPMQIHLLNKHKGLPINFVDGILKRLAFTIGEWRKDLIVIRCVRDILPNFTCFVERISLTPWQGDMSFVKEIIPSIYVGKRLSPARFWAVTWSRMRSSTCFIKSTLE